MDHETSVLIHLVLRPSPAVLMILPSGSTTSRFITFSLMVPYLRERERDIREGKHHYTLYPIWSKIHTFVWTFVWFFLLWTFTWMYDDHSYYTENDLSLIQFVIVRHVFEDQQELFWYLLFQRQLEDDMSVACLLLQVTFVLFCLINAPHKTLH